MAWRDESWESEWRQWREQDAPERRSYLLRLNDMLNEHGCTDTAMGDRVAWLERQLQELSVYRSANDGRMTDVVGRFMNALMTNDAFFHRHVPGDAISVLQFALHELERFAALQRHLRETDIWVRFTELLPDEDEEASGD